MDNSPGTRGYDAASAVVWFIGISQGLVPLVVAGVFDRDGRFALPLLLPEPWWWIACLAVLVLAVVALLAIDARRRAAVPESGEAAGTRGPTAPAATTRCPVSCCSSASTTAWRPSSPG